MERRRRLHNRLALPACDDRRRESIASNSQVGADRGKSRPMVLVSAETCCKYDGRQAHELRRTPSPSGVDEQRRTARVMPESRRPYLVWNGFRNGFKLS
jgi:hypothetical protein